MSSQSRLGGVGSAVLVAAIGWGAAGAFADHGHEGAEHAEFTPLFNGEDLSGWIGDERFWRVEGGLLIAETTEDNPTERNTFLIWDRGEVDDFELKVEYRITSESANSGVQIRSVHEGDYVVSGYQPDIATEDWITGIQYEERGRGLIARRGQKVEVGDGERSVRVLEEFGDSDELGGHIHANDWNEYHIIARGNRIESRINGEKMSEMIDVGETDARESGVLALQLHAGEPMTIQFRNIELRRLPLAGDRKKVVMVAGSPSHGYGSHEHNAGTMLFKRLLDESDEGLVSTIYHDGWPEDPTAFDNADAVVIYADGGGGHPVNPHLDAFQEVMDRGVGLVCIHYGVEVPKGEEGDRFLEWIGGYFETDWSVNPHWTLRETEIAEDHPITRGVSPYEINDEWYYHMRFREDMEGVTPILSAMPPASSLERPDGPHSNNPHVREAVLERGEKQHVVWAAEREDGGRGFGFTGGHWHWNWGHPNQRKIVLNAIAWAAGAEVPGEGIEAGTLTLEDLEANQDYDPPADFDRERWERVISEWHEGQLSGR